MIGVLALQGGFIEHIRALDQLGAASFEIRQKADLAGKQIDGLILPGGESTVMGKLLHESGLLRPLKTLITNGLPTFGTCAGLILLAQRLENGEKPYFAAMHITAKRNAFGRQMGSFFTTAPFKGLGQVPMAFIRAPYIVEVAGGAEILAAVGEHIVAARENNLLATAFHPELTDDLRVHQYFLAMGGPRPN